MTALIIRGDARYLPLPDASVDAIITSPPYWSLRSYTDNGEHYDGQLGSEESPKEFVANLVDCTREWVRVLKPSGNMFVNLGDKYAGSGGHNNSNLAWSNSDRKRDVPRQRGATRRNAPDRYKQHTGGVRPKSLMGLPWRYALECIDTLGLILRAEIIWDKPNGLPESVRDRVARKHEQWFHLTKDAKPYAEVDPLRTPAKIVFTARQDGTEHHARAIEAAEGHHRYNERTNNPLGVLPGSVWRIPSEQLRIPDSLEIDHFAAFPSEWPMRLILGWCPPGGVVLDLFGGTGTTALAAQELGRVGITNDLSGDYCRLAQWRTTDPSEREAMRKRIKEHARERGDIPQIAPDPNTPTLFDFGGAA